MQCHIMYVMNLAEVRTSGVRSVAGYGQNRSRHREGSMPRLVSYISVRARLAMPLTLIAEYNALAISLSCSSLGLLPRISGSQNWPTAPFMCPILPCASGGALTHCDGSRPTPHTIYACVKVLGVLWLALTLSCDGMGAVIREWRDDVRLGIIRECSPWCPSRPSRVTGLSRFSSRV